MEAECGKLQIKKRMGIFVFYDESGVVDPYIEVLLESMQKILQKLLIVVNGRIKDNESAKLKVYSNDIFMRENIGFDAGCYKDVFTKFISGAKLKQWDEIVLFNDTFYGPLYPWKDVFDQMESERVDFWGLSRHGGGIAERNVVPPHIQSFFLVCRQNLVVSASWEKFWSDLKYPMTRQETVDNFEINFSVYFTQNGFRCTALTDMSEATYSENPYFHYPYELIRDIKFPIIKRKVITIGNFTSIQKALNYISENTDYDIGLIYSNIRRLKKDGRHNLFYPFNEVNIESFYNTHKRIFIYGHGKYGQGMALYFEYKAWKYEGFLVTNKEDDKEKGNVFVYHNMNFDKDDGIILALGKKVFSEVYSIVREKFDKSQLLLPDFG